MVNINKIIIIYGITGIIFLEYLAIKNGIDGKVLTFSISSISFLIGYCFKIKNSKGGE